MEKKAATPVRKTEKSKGTPPAKQANSKRTQTDRTAKQSFKFAPADTKEVTIIEVEPPKIKMAPPAKSNSQELEYKRIGTRMRARRIALGMSMNQTAQKIGCTATTLKRWEEGDIKSIKSSRVKDICRALNTTPADLFGIEEYTVSLPGVKAVKSSKRVPIKNSAKAVKSVDLISGATGDAILPPNVNAEYCYTMPNDAMINARIFKGDQVYIKRVKSSDEVKNGEIALVVAGGKELLRRVYRFKGYMDLRAENPRFEPITFEGLEQTGVEIIGKAVAFMAVL